MTLNRDDFPGLTDEQWAKIEAENDRRATQATKTARQGLLTADEVQAQIDAALNAERERLALGEAERLEADRKALELRAAAVKADERKFKAERKLTAAGLPQDKIDGLLPLFTGVDDTALDTTVESFINVYKDGVAAQVDTEKKALLNNATPPAGPINGPVDLSAKVQEHLAAGNEVAAVDALLTQAGYTTK